VIATTTAPTRAVLASHLSYCVCSKRKRKFEVVGEPSLNLKGTFSTL
jgi:hypothetical protein